MSYLERRIRYLLDEFRAGRLHLPQPTPENQIDRLVAELETIRETTEGRINLSTCGPMVRSFARMIYLTRGLKEETTEPQGSSKHPEDIAVTIELQRKFFSLMDEFFRRATGEVASRFASTEGFSRELRTNAERISHLSRDAFPWASEQFSRFYREHPTLGYGVSRQLGGMKLVFAGQRFPGAALLAARKVLLYADTIFIPDPVLPWFEHERKEEAFPHANALEAAFLLLQLKPLVDADLPYPAIVVFPSWEKTMERVDEVVQDGIGKLAIDFFSHHLAVRFEDESEIFEYAQTQEDSFLRAVDEHRLFFPPEGVGTESLGEAIRLYREMLARERSPEYREKFGQLSTGALVANGIFERLIPLYHLRENADVLSAHPLMWLQAQWHYHSLCGRMSEGHLAEASLLRPETIGMLRSLEEPRFKWLGNVPIEDLVRLRREDANADFRQALCRFTTQLHEASLEDLDRVAGDVMRGVTSLFASHERQVERIDREYRKRHSRILAGSLISFSANFLPWLAPYAGPVAPLALGSKYIWDKIDERKARQEASRSLAGVLAAAKARDD